MTIKPIKTEIRMVSKKIGANLRESQEKLSVVLYNHTNGMGRERERDLPVLCKAFKA